MLSHGLNVARSIIDGHSAAFPAGLKTYFTCFYFSRVGSHWLSNDRGGAGEEKSAREWDARRLLTPYSGAASTWEQCVESRIRVGRGRLAL